MEKKENVTGILDYCKTNISFSNMSESNYKKTLIFVLLMFFKHHISIKSFSNSFHFIFATRMK